MGKEAQSVDRDWPFTACLWLLFSEVNSRGGLSQQNLNSIKALVTRD